MCGVSGSFSWEKAHLLTPYSLLLFEAQQTRLSCFPSERCFKCCTNRSSSLGVTCLFLVREMTALRLRAEQMAQALHSDGVPWFSLRVLVCGDNKPEDAAAPPLFVKTQLAWGRVGGTPATFFHHDDQGARPWQTGNAVQPAGLSQLLFTASCSS